MAVRYAHKGDVNLAFDVLGDGDRDLLVTFGWVVSFASLASYPPHARWLERLSGLGRVIVWDKRGTGLSERVPPDRLPTLEDRMDDLRAVMDAAGSERALVFGVSEGGALSALFAASHPDRASGLVVYGGFPRMLRDDDYAWAPTREDADRFEERASATWGDNAWLLKLWAPSIATDAAAQVGWNRVLVEGATPATAIAWRRMARETDVRDVLPAIRVPTLVLRREDDRIVPVQHGRHHAEQVPDARFVELPGSDHLWWVDGDDILDEVESFVTGAPAHREPDRVLATVLFTDIVDSTRRAAELGDGRWRDLVEAHDQFVRAQLERFRGEEIKTLGDGFLATFDGPGRAIRCARTILRRVGELGLTLRAGLHTGELERIGADIGGLAVNIGSPGRCPGGSRRAARVQHGQGSRGGLGVRVRGSRRARAQGRSRRLFAVGGHP